jgi:hypothetical protein
VSDQSPLANAAFVAAFAFLAMASFVAALWMMKELQLRTAPYSWGVFLLPVFVIAFAAAAWWKLGQRPRLIAQLPPDLIRRRRLQNIGVLLFLLSNLLGFVMLRASVNEEIRHSIQIGTNVLGLLCFVVSWSVRPDFAEGSSEE